MHFAICLASSGSIAPSRWSLRQSQIAVAMIAYTWCRSAITASLNRANVERFRRSVTSQRSDESANSDRSLRARQRISDPLRTHGLPGVIGKKAKPRLLRLLCDQNHRWGSSGFCDFAFVLHRRFRLFWIGGLELLWIGRFELCKGLQRARLGRHVRDRCRNAGLSVCNQSGNNRRDAGIENNALRPFPIGADPDDGFLDIGVCRADNRRTRRIGINYEEQREQNSANVQKISRQGHLRVAPPTRPRGPSLNWGWPDWFQVPPGRCNNEVTARYRLSAGTRRYTRLAVTSEHLA